METECVSVVVIKNNVIDQSFLIVGEHDTISMQAEAKFLELCRVNISNFDEYNEADLNAVIDNGYEEFGNGSVCITWPDVIIVKPAWK